MAARPRDKTKKFNRETFKSLACSLARCNSCGRHAIFSSNRLCTCTSRSRTLSYTIRFCRLAGIFISSIVLHVRVNSTCPGHYRFGEKEKLLAWDSRKILRTFSVSFDSEWRFCRICKERESLFLSSETNMKINFDALVFREREDFFFKAMQCALRLCSVFFVKIFTHICLPRNLRLCSHMNENYITRKTAGLRLFDTRVNQAVSK